MRQIGEYLGRAVRVIGAASPTAVPCNELEGSAVALLCCDDGPVIEWRPALTQLFTAAPVAIGFWGSHASAALSVALEVQATRADTRHVMTYLLSSETAVEALWEFLQVVFPTPERLGDWNSYSIIVVANGYSRIEARLEAALREGYEAIADLRFRPPS